MRITLIDNNRSSDVELATSGWATVADLSAAAGWNGTSTLRVDDDVLNATTKLAQAGIRSGSIVGPQPVQRQALPPAGTPRVAVVGGLDAGGRHPFYGYEGTIGRAVGCEIQLNSPTVSQQHARYVFAGDDLYVYDLGSTNGTWVNDEVVDSEGVVLNHGDRIRLGSVILEAGVEDDADRAALPASDRGATIRFLRKPREAPMQPPDPVEEPEKPPPPPGTSRQLTVTMFVAPLVMASVMVTAFGSWRFALFALMSPLVLLGNRFEGKRREKQMETGENKQFNKALEEFEGDLAEAKEFERERRRATAPDPSESLRRAILPSVTLWERRANAYDVLALHLGVGVAPWDPITNGEGRGTKEIRRRIQQNSSIDNCTVIAEMAGRPHALAGDRSTTTAVARSLICQAATHHGPSDLAIAVIAERQRLSQWEWLKWLPHATNPSHGEPRAAAQDQAAELLADLADGDQPVLMVVDADPESPVISDIARALSSRQDSSTALVVADEARTAPSWCQAVVQSHGVDGEAFLAEPGRRRNTGPFISAGVTTETADGWVRSLARLNDPEAMAEGRDLPPQVTLDSVTGIVENVDDLRERWESYEPGAIPIAVGARGPVGVDFETAGPFAVLVGGAGTGRSTALRTLGASIICSASPEDANLVLWSLSEPSFGPLTNAPHVAAAMTGPGAKNKVLDALRAEVARRTGGHIGPLLIVLVDDAQAVTNVADTTLDELADIAGRGASTGVYVVLSSRRWGGTLSRSAGSIPGPRIALRLSSPSDAKDVTGETTAASFEREYRGRSMIVNDDARGVAQIAYASTAERERPAVEINPFDLTLQRQGQVSDPEAEEKALDELVNLAKATGVQQAESLFAEKGTKDTSTPTLNLAELLGQGPAAVDAQHRWSTLSEERNLIATIGTVPGGARCDLNIREAAQGGSGPHGVVVGATGSGKSEFLRTFLADLLANHSPERLAMVLVDFKGGATFGPVEQLPHIAGVITNLENDPTMIDRMQKALEGEMRRRQKMLQDAGVANLLGYWEARERGDVTEPLPSLLIMIDEFAEMLEQQPDFLEVLGTIGRVGRSLGVHLMLASQRLEEGRLKGLDSHLRYRVALRTFNASDSRNIIGTVDAASLPSKPGGGYLKLDDELVRFQSGYVSGEVDDTGITEFDQLAQRLNVGDPVHQVWLPPLKANIPLDRVTGGTAHDPDRGLVTPHWPSSGKLLVPLGVMDVPEDQMQSAFPLDLSGGGGNVAVVGAPQLGKSTVLRTIVTGLALTHTPDEVQFYGIDHGGGALGVLNELPHTGTIAGRRDTDLTHRVLRHILALLAFRERAFDTYKADGMAAYRRKRTAGEIPDDPYGDVFLLLDGWNSFKKEYPDQEATIIDIAARGLGYGVHVLLGANRWMDMRSGLRDGFGTKFELRLSDPFESSHGRKVGAALPAGIPGRGIAPDKHHVQVALPRTDGRESNEDIGDALGTLVTQIADAWNGPAAPPVRLLPDHLTAADLPAPTDGAPQAIPIGISEIDLGPAHVDLTGSQPHFLVFGDSESGKTTFLKQFATQLVERCTPDQARIMVIDYRRELLELVPESHLLAFSGNEESALVNADRLKQTLEKRVPPDDISAKTLRERSWWSGAEIYLLVDDYDLVGASKNPLSALAQFLPQARDVGFHLVMTRRSAGAARGFDQMLQRIRDLGTGGLLLSGDPKEGVLLGGLRPTRLPLGRAQWIRKGSEGALVQLADIFEEQERPT